jgi:phthalate 4,5-dioxygenase
MLKADNEYLCRVGKGTPMGEMMRRFWHPVCLSAELPVPDSNPVRVTLLGERLVVFRNTEGRIGVLEELCMHRRASLALGRVENCGIRCIYHGWKFGVDGQLLDLMNHPDPKYMERMKQPAFPADEAGGIVWAYMGPAEKQPPLPRFAFMDLPESHRYAYKVTVPCNYLQNLEAGLDTTHVGILHSNLARPEWKGDKMPGIERSIDVQARLDIEETDFGYHYAAIRKPRREDDPSNVRIVPFVMPYGRIIPGRKGSRHQTMAFEVPNDDTTVTTFLSSYDLDQPVDVAKMLRERGLDDPAIFDPVTCTLKLSWDNNLGQDRSAMSESWSGLDGIRLEDAAMSLSMEAISDRENENLVPADMAVLRVRRRLRESAERVARGEDPIGLHTDAARIDAIDADLPSDAHWRTLVPTHVAELA